MKFYAYIPNETGNEPMGTGRRLLFELKTMRGAIRRARRILGDSVIVQRYINIYVPETFTVVYKRI